MIFPTRFKRFPGFRGSFLVTRPSAVKILFNRCFVMRVVITGAAGRIGAQMVEDLRAEHELVLIDRMPISGRTSIVADLADRKGAGLRKFWHFRAWESSFKSVDVVLHLAADMRHNASWDSVLHNNIQATWKVIEVAARYQVPRVVFASSNWAVRALEQALAPACYQPGGPKIGSADSPRPLRPYGISKALGEQAGRMFVEQKQLHSFIAVRIGAYAPEPHRSDERLRALWIGSRDIRALLRRCVESTGEGFHVVYGVSAQPIAPYDLTYTRDFLSWKPCQNSLDDCSGTENR
jgi:nucleoside-diphosphate-sugar epimerase